MNEIGGLTGKILRINLTTKTSTIENTPIDAVKKFIGGRGLGLYFLNKEVEPKVSPLSPENKLIFMTGPLTGTLISGSNKITVTFKSPLTNTYSYSLCGGHFGPELKFAGYDGIIIEGKIEEPTYLWIKDDKIEFRSAKHLKNKLIPETERLIRQELEDSKFIQIAVIGPSGENLNKYACITSGLSREFGRGGAGAVMGSKNLKGIAISGTKDICYYKVDEIKEIAERFTSQLRESPGGIIRRKYGTPELVEKINSNGSLCANNFQEGFSEEGYKYYGPQMREDIVVGDSSCYGCPVGCGKRSKIKSPQFGEILLEGPEFETIGMLGTNCGLSDWETLMKATQICDEYGFDTMNAGGCISLAMECFEKGIIGLEETDGIDLKFGNKDAIIQILNKIGLREGIGDILAEGVVFAAEKFGAPNLAIHSKGQVFAVYDPRGTKAMALAYATSPKGAHHMVATTMGFEINSGTGLSIKDNGSLERKHQFSMCIVDSIAICSTMRAGISLKDQIIAYSVITGLEIDEKGLNLAAERIINLERLYNIRLGYSRKEDTIPERFLKEPLSKGKSKGSTVDLKSMLDDFYSVMGWDDNGTPTSEKLKELGLTEYVTK